MTTLEAAPIACTLTRGDFKDRASWIRELASRSLRAARRTPLALHLTYAPEAAAQVRELVAEGTDVDRELLVRHGTLLFEACLTAR